MSQIKVHYICSREALSKTLLKSLVREHKTVILNTLKYFHSGYMGMSMGLVTTVITINNSYNTNQILNITPSKNQNICNINPIYL